MKSFLNFLIALIAINTNSIQTRWNVIILESKTPKLGELTSSNLVDNKFY